MEENIHNNNDEISLKELLEKGKEWFHYLLSQWKIIVLAGIIGGVLGLTYSLVFMIFKTSKGIMNYE